jgi:hypothetical protein
MSRWFLRFQPLGGSSQRYLDTTTGLTISRRRFLAYQGIAPELRAKERFWAGLSTPHKRRCDAGKARTGAPVDGPCWAALQSKRLRSGRVIQLVPFEQPQRFLVVVEQVPVAEVAKYGTPRARWHCARCGLQLDKCDSMLQHVVSFHFAQQCAVQGVAAPTTSYVGHVTTHERRARMPWRVAVPEKK